MGGDQLFTHRTNLPSCPPTNPSRVQHDRHYISSVGSGRGRRRYLEQNPSLHPTSLELPSPATADPNGISTLKLQRVLQRHRTKRLNMPYQGDRAQYRAGTACERELQPQAVSTVGGGSASQNSIIRGILP